MPRSKSKKSLKRFSKAQRKDPVSMLYHLKPDIIFKVLEQTGPEHSPMFTMKVDVDSHYFCGTGQSKKEAKFMAALAALEFLGYDPSGLLKISPNKNIVSKHVASTSDIGDKHPIAILISLNHRVKVSKVLQQTGPARNASFKMEVNVNGQSFCGIGNTKKIATFRAAATALECLGYDPSSRSKIPINKDLVSNHHASVDQTDVRWTGTKRVEYDEKHPISQLKALNYKVKSYEVVQESGPAQSASVKMKLVVKGRPFYGTGKSKESAELQAAFTALRHFQNHVPKMKVKTSNQFKKIERISREEQFKLLQQQVQIINEVYPIHPNYEGCDENDLLSSD